MTRRRIELVVALTAVIVLCLASVATETRSNPASLITGNASCEGHPDVTAAGIPAGPTCIPCSPNHPCVNPLTVCSYNGNSHHGCCLGYAGQE